MYLVKPKPEHQKGYAEKSRNGMGHKVIFLKELY
jgi:hypothetical protein